MVDQSSSVFFAGKQGFFNSPLTAEDVTLEPAAWALREKMRRGGVEMSVTARE